jgi:hypothetical protein
VRRSVAILALPAALVLAPTRSLVGAQTVAADSQVVRAAVSTLMKELAPSLSTVVKDAPPRTWLLDFPDDNRGLWAPVRTELLHTLNGREPTGADSVLALATVSQLVATGDSLIFKISIGSQWKCEDHWRGKGTVTTYTAHRDHGQWSPPMQAERHVFDSDPC